MTLVFGELERKAAPGREGRLFLGREGKSDDLHTSIVNPRNKGINNVHKYTAFYEGSHV